MASRNGDATTVEYGAFVVRCVRALGRRGSAGNGDTDALRALADVVDAVDLATYDVVTALRSYPSACSWAEIGAVLDIPRQTAQRRFHKAGGVRRAGGQPAKWR